VSVQFISVTSLCTRLNRSSQAAWRRGIQSDGCGHWSTQPSPGLLRRHIWYRGVTSLPHCTVYRRHYFDFGRKYVTSQRFYWFIFFTHWSS